MRFGYVASLVGCRIYAITTVADDKGKRAGYARYVLNLGQRQEIPVAAGADIGLGCYRIKPGFQGIDYWGNPIAPSPNALDNALSLLKESIEQDATVVAIGPFTNLHLLDKKYPGILANAKLFLMGGYIYPPRESFPQWGINMDYNVQVDVESAEYVLEHSQPTLVQLSVTFKTSLRRAYVQTLRNAGALGKLLARQAEACAKDWKNEEKFGKTCSGLPRDTINFQHDPLTCAIAAGWNEGVETNEIPLKLELRNGWLHQMIDAAGKPTRVVTRIDGNKFNEFWFGKVSGISR